MSKDTTGWLSWCSMKAGNDGRRNSGIVWQRTKLAHHRGVGSKTLCNREILCLEKSEEAGTRPRCQVCEKRSKAKADGK